MVLVVDVVDVVVVDVVDVVLVHGNNPLMPANKKSVGTVEPNSPNVTKNVATFVY